MNDFKKKKIKADKKKKDVHHMTVVPRKKDTESKAEKDERPLVRYVKARMTR